MRKPAGNRCTARVDRQQPTPEPQEHSLARRCSIDSRHSASAGSSDMQPAGDGHDIYIAALAPMDSGMNLPTSSFRSQDDASRVMISTIFFRIRRIWLVWA